MPNNYVVSAYAALVLSWAHCFKRCLGLFSAGQAGRPARSDEDYRATLTYNFAWRKKKKKENG